MAVRTPDDPPLPQKMNGAIEEDHDPVQRYRQKQNLIRLSVVSSETEILREHAPVSVALEIELIFHAMRLSSDPFHGEP